MRFGIMAMQINSLIPSGNSPQEMMANLAGFDQTKLVKGLIEKGFNPIEIGGDLSMFLPHTFGAETIQKLADLKHSGLNFTVHLPLWSVEPSTPLNPVRRGSADSLIQIIEATRPLEPEVYVMHATGALAAEFYRMRLPESARQVLLRQFQAGARDSLRRILQETCLPSRHLAIETIEFPLELTLELANELDLSICFDTGHVLAGFSGDVDFFDALELCLPRLAEVHLHDSPAYKRTHQLGYGQDHAVLGTGDLELVRFLQRLEKSTFRGPIIFELTVDQALESMEEIHSMAPQFLPS